jgi:hypothetical protein
LLNRAALSEGDRIVSPSFAVQRLDLQHEV